MYELALFAGAGGGVLGGTLLGWRTVGAVEINPYCREVPLRRQEDAILPPFPIWDDVRTFTKRNNQCRPFIRALCSIRRELVITAGFPCQPFSVAGKRHGADDERNMWPDTIRILREIRPRFALLENVPGLLSTPYWGTILGDLAESGFDAKWRMLSAAECGAPHRRDRLWILAHDGNPVANAKRMRWATGRDNKGGSNTSPTRNRQTQETNGRGRIPNQTCRIGGSENVADAEQMGCSTGARRARQAGERGTELVGSRPDVAVAAGNGWEQGGTESAGKQGRSDAAKCGGPMADADARSLGWPAKSWCECNQWATEPDVGRVANGVAFRVDRLAALGNGQVPIVAATAWRLLTEFGDNVTPPAAP